MIMSDRPSSDAKVGHLYAPEYQRANEPIRTGAGVPARRETYLIGGLVGVAGLVAWPQGRAALRPPPVVSALGIGGLFGYYVVYFAACASPRGGRIIHCEQSARSPMKR